ncbi:type II secretion system protein [Thalassotalea euphylliae]|uniref:Type II secretion system protein n=1 Tax=Thalassotalea euphylliae TaxID=1655234 RepID=A0A3E0UJ82_9GAMM|nr:type II secretion system protein [Thalassotalea euphylliae]REL36677.1 type II secretion system protein [Thalassotalea euphylliae]
MPSRRIHLSSTCLSSEQAGLQDNHKFNQLGKLQLKKTKGFTLIELIIGIVVLSISFSVITSLVIPTTVQSANQLHQIRAAELGQTVMNEILARSFDENSDHVGGIVRCSSSTCSSAGALGPDGVIPNQETRENYNDVDDFQCYDTSNPEQSFDLTCANLVNWGKAPYTSDIYRNFRVAINVFYDGNYDGINDNGYAVAKRIGVEVRAPDGEIIAFSTYKVNF